MNKRAALRVGVSAILCLVMCLGLTAQIQSGPTERALDQIAPKAAGVHLAIFNPEMHNIQSLEVVRKNRIFEIPDLTVIGIYHNRQTDDFAAARKYVAENKLDWFKFHVVTAEISEADVFRTNAWTPEFEAIVQKADGVIFFGGPDVPPAIYHEKTNLLTSIEDPYRHYLELSAVFHLLGGSQDDNFKPLLARRPGFPVFGICLGFQTLNVGTGGTLIQDIWTESYGKSTVEDVIALGPEQWHRNPYPRLHPLDKIMGANFHSLELVATSKFCAAMGFKTSDHPRILSSHHQAAKALGKGLVVVATSRDGRIAEAVEHRVYPNVLGVQFHPESLGLWDSEPRVREKPGDPLTSGYSILVGSPPSLRFNKAIWSWFAGRLKESRTMR